MADCLVGKYEFYFNDGSSGNITKKLSMKNYHKKIYHTGIFDNFDREIPIINLFKLHGSVSWKYINDKNNKPREIKVEYFEDNYTKYPENLIEKVSNEEIDREKKEIENNRIQGAISIRENLQNRTIEIDIVESAPFNSSYNKKIKDKEYIGVAICLFVEVCKRSFENGYDGYVEFTAKSNLVKYYMDNMRAIPIDAQRMYINTSGAKWLIEKYYGGVDL